VPPKGLNVHFANGRVAEIELLQNSFVESWYTAFSANQHIPRWTKCHSTLLHTGPYKEFYDASIADSINQAIADVEAITGREWIGRAYNGMSWADTNWLHRGFTTSMITGGLTPILSDELHLEIAEIKRTGQVTHFELCDIIRFHPTLQDYYQLGAKKAQVWPALHDALHRINSYIHVYETLFLRSGRAWELDVQSYILDIDIDLKRQDGSLLYPVHEEQIRADQKRHAFHGYEFNVYALKKILGKDYLTAYFEYDDPRRWDITNAMVTDGSFQIDYNDNYRQVHESPGFQSWATHYGVNNPATYSNFQIGRVTNPEFIQAIVSAQPSNVEGDRATATKESETHSITPQWAVEHIEVIE
jgi:hypothetical protein